MPNPDLLASPKYVAIADALCRDIRNGRLVPGEKLPAQRELSYALNINFGTVTKAYALAAERGMVKGEIGRGTFVRKDPPSARTPWPREDQLAGRIDLRSDFPCSLAKDPVFKKGFQELGNHPDFASLLQYQPGSARTSHLEAGSHWLKKLGITADPDQVIITNGALHGGFLSLMAMTRPGDTILTDTTTSPAIRSIAAMLHLVLKPVAMDKMGMVPEDLEEKINSFPCRVVYLIPNFHNPTTAVMPQNRRQSIAEIIERSGLFLIEDDVFGGLSRGMGQNKEPEKIQENDGPLAPVSSLIPNQSFYVTSFSKGIAPGLRVGYALAPQAFYNKMLTGLRITSWMASPLMAELVSQWIWDGNAQRLFGLQARELARRTGVVKKILAPFELGLHDHCPHVWLKLPPSMRESHAVMALSSKGIDVTPGEYFSVAPGFMPGGLRLCLGQIDDINLLESACRVIAATLSQAPAMLGTDI
ncbi:MAG: PLP-dependent aminotransferase family protein [Proteobacteria bacterium]|nr:PLP-dependent aminotransferase family protein [Pseudomonadota bacterium]